MKDNYKVFDKGFNKVLDLVESKDKSIFNNFKTIIDIIPDNVIDAISSCDDFATEEENFNVDFMRLVNAVSLEFTNNNKYLKSDVYVHRIFEEDLFKQELNLKIFSINMRNTFKKMPKLELFYEQVGDKYKFVGSNDKDKEKILDYTCEIYLANKEDEFYLNIINQFRGIELSNIQIPITFDELMNYVEVEDEFEEDMEIEFDADFEL